MIEALLTSQNWSRWSRSFPSLFPSLSKKLYKFLKAQLSLTISQKRNNLFSLLSPPPLSLLFPLMGFPVGYSEVFLPKLFVHILSFLGFIRNLILCLFNYLGLSGFLETDNIWPDNPIRMSCYPPLSAALLREILPVIKFEDLVTGDGGCCDLPESCAVCLYEFEGEDEIRWLKNCKHIFHRTCLDRWMDHDRKTCPLCRNSFVPDEMQEEFNQRLWAANNDVSDFYCE